MGGIYGYLFKRPGTAPVELEALDRMGAALGSAVAPSTPRAHTLRIGCIALGAVESPHRQVTVLQVQEASASVAIAFYGNLCEIGGIDATSFDGARIGRDLLARYAARGESFLDDLRGEFALAIKFEAAGGATLTARPTDPAPGAPRRCRTAGRSGRAGCGCRS